MISSFLNKRQTYLPKTRKSQDIGNKIVHGSMWSGLEVLSTTILQFVRSIIFARLLMPEDFGILSLANVFTEFVLIFANFGFTASIIYQDTLDKEDLSTNWWGNVFVDTTAASICLLVAFFSFKYTKDIVTSHIIVLLSIQFIIVSFGSVNMALMRRAFKFKELTLSKLSSAFTSFFMSLIFIKVFDLGIYGLVLGMICGNIVLTLLYFYNLPWFPSLHFSFDKIRKHLRYGSWFLGVSISSYVNQNMDKAIIGTYLNTTQLGYYEYANNIPLLVANKISILINGVLFPAFSSLQNNYQELRALLKKIYRYNAFIIFPILVGIAVVAPDFVTTAYGEKWQPIIGPLRMFCLFGVLSIFTNSFSVLCNGIGRPQVPLKWHVVYLPINAGLLFIGVSYYGLLGAVSALLIMPIFMSLSMGMQMLKIIDLKYYDLIKSVIPASICCFFMAISVYLCANFVSVKIDISILRLLLEIFVGIATYCLSVYLLFKADVKFFIDKFLKRQFRRKISRQVGR